MDNVTQKTTKVEGKKKTWPLSDAEVAEREKALDRDLAEQEKVRSRLSKKQLRLTEVKEKIRQTDLGQEQEELKVATKEMEFRVNALATNIEKLAREVRSRCTTDPQADIPGADVRGTPPPKASAAERTLPLLPAKPKDDVIDAEIVDEPRLPGGETKALPAAPAPAGPLPCPTLPAKGHPQRVLRSWLYARLCQAGELTAAQLCAEATGYHPEYLRDTVSLLEACELVGPWKGKLTAFENETGRTVDERVQDVVRAALTDGPLDAPALAAALSVPVPVILDVLGELAEAGRVERRKHLWHQAERVEGAAQ